MSYQYPPPHQSPQQPYQQPPRWSPPPAPARGGGVARNFFGTFLALVLTPIGITLVALGAEATGRWEGYQTSDRLGPNLQLIGGAFLLLLVAALAAMSPVGTMLAGLLWGLIPGIAGLLLPDDTAEFLTDLSVLPRDTRIALSMWAIGGGLFVVGALLFGAGLAAGLRRR
ncbi:hypothetical protein [Nocardia bovistercoris]|uniref:Uncharacterized protein n=1 Tax=Nocardia bovistercoris TaxID=2785916 RepID=A0A931N5D9_9NOCA|nr:hypothetical protein [Nocardia bovistercoris]MBH0779301.1 hypothetical protein [Nocardia bovistercoris]